MRRPPFQVTCVSSNQSDVFPSSISVLCNPRLISRSGSRTSCWERQNQHPLCTPRENHQANDKRNCIHVLSVVKRTEALESTNQAQIPACPFMGYVVSGDHLTLSVTQLLGLVTLTPQVAVMTNKISWVEYLLKRLRCSSPRINDRFVAITIINANKEGSSSRSQWVLEAILMWLPLLPLRGTVVALPVHSPGLTDGTYNRGMDALEHSILLPCAP